MTLQLENKRQLTGNLHRLSINGGLVEVVPYIDERSKIMMALQLGAGLLEAKAETMFPMRGGMGYFQPFRFTGFATGARHTLELQIAALLKQTIGPNHVVGANAPQFFLDVL